MDVSGELRYYAHTLNAKFKELLLVAIADVHYGNHLCSVSHFQRMIAYVRSKPNIYCVLNGDLCEAAIRASLGDIYKQVPSPQEQRDWMISQLIPIKDRILGVTTGNHENRIYKDTGMDISLDIARAVNAPYRPEGMLLKISFGDNNNRTSDKPYVYWVYFTHGYGGARTKSAKAVKVERIGSWIDADVYIMAHDHVVNVAPDVYLKPDNRTMVDKDTGFTTGKVVASRKMLVKSNAYLKFGGYGEMGGFPPVDLVVPVIKFAGTGKPHVSVEV